MTITINLEFIPLWAWIVSAVFAYAIIGSAVGRIILSYTKDEERAVSGGFIWPLVGFVSLAVYIGVRIATPFLKHDSRDEQRGSR